MKLTSCRLSVPADVLPISEHMRKADVDEVRAAVGLSPIEALTKGFTDSDECWTIAPSGYPVGMFGVVKTVNPTVGAVWMLATDGLLNHRRQFVRESRRWFDMLHARYPVLWNFVDERNTVHIRWLKWLGCQFIARHERTGVEQIPFLEFIHVCPSRNSACCRSS